jgi:polyribonucleotide nucleotidyltransferase
MFEIVEKTIKIGNQTITLETGRIARQAQGAVLVSSGGTQVLVAVTAAKEPKPDQGFFPLSVDYIEKVYSAGRIPGGYFKRETKPTDREVLTSRLIDRPIRPLFPETYLCETQVVCTVMSYDPDHAPSELASLGASAALHISSVPFGGPTAAVRVAEIDGKFVLNPPEAQLETAALDILVAGTRDAILMVECVSNFADEEKILEAMELAQANIKKLCDMQDQLRKEVGREKASVPDAPANETIRKNLEKSFGTKLKAAYKISSKAERYAAINEIKQQAKEACLVDENAGASKEFAYHFEELRYRILRTNIIKENKRVDGRKTDEIRDIDCQLGILKRVHGSALFTRGETQSIGIATLGTTDDAQRLETIAKLADEKRFMLHYNMPGYSVGEPKRLGAPGRREVGHGNLAERALRAVIPNRLKFPYTIRLVSEITESNGSSSMASVCSGSLALMEAGVPVESPVAGIAMGLIKEGKSFAILSDILGDEDALGDMDFKVAGSDSGITALQMDMKIAGVSLEIMKQALEQARVGRLHILGIMNKTINKPKDLSPYAPRIERIKIKSDKIRDLIGPGGKNIKKIVSESGCKVDLDENGVVNVSSTDGQSAAKAKRMIQYLTSDPEIGQVYLGVVKKISDFGAFVEFKPGVEGLVHISQLAPDRVAKVEDVVKENEEVLVKVIEIDRTGRIKLSRKDAIGKTPVDAADFKS